MTPSFLPDEHILRVTIDRTVSVGLVCTDEDLEELITGYLYNEGLISSQRDIRKLHIWADHNAAEVVLESSRAMPERKVRPSGLGGSLLDTEIRLQPREVKARYAMAYICRCAQSMEAQAVRYVQTGGMHCSALFDTERQLSLFEDIGRHNTLDKLAGDCMLRGFCAEDTLLITTGRISADMVRKAARIGASVIASYSTPTQKAFLEAKKANITLISYLKKEKRTVCVVPERIVT